MPWSMTVVPELGASIGTSLRRIRFALGALLSASAQAAPGIAAPFTLTPPPALHAAPVSRAASGNTYAYLPQDLRTPQRLMITTIMTGEIRARFGALSDTHCIRLFLDELRKEHQNFFAVDMTSPLTVGEAEFRRVRWTGEKNGRALTGVLACGERQDYYYVVHYVDAIASATASFPAIRASLHALRSSSP